MPSLVIRDDVRKSMSDRRLVRCLMPSSVIALLKQRVREVRLVNRLIPSFVMVSIDPNHNDATMDGIMSNHALDT
jgi:hypothetical protein